MGNTRLTVYSSKASVFGLCVLFAWMLILFQRHLFLASYSFELVSFMQIPAHWTIEFSFICFCWLFSEQKKAEEEAKVDVPQIKVEDTGEFENLDPETQEYETDYSDKPPEEPSELDIVNQSSVSEECTVAQSSPQTEAARVSGGEPETLITDQQVSEHPALPRECLVLVFTHPFSPAILFHCLLMLLEDASLSPLFLRYFGNAEW